MSVGISTLALHFAGYKPGACRQNPAVITALRVLFAPVPVVLLLIGLVLFYSTPSMRSGAARSNRNYRKQRKWLETKKWRQWDCRLRSDTASMSSWTLPSVSVFV
ncbi:unnamed protein product [Oncorhynchus mykiss]|uniref:Uncharacterized protein n=1 Tax=Oncorhynchus mykiss TaxID=8022 RepID=A0A060ZBD7_ONCMY|nr:unnamed protein product [Oncorhynchus mykiss]